MAWGDLISDPPPPPTSSSLPPQSPLTPSLSRTFGRARAWGRGVSRYRFSPRPCRSGRLISRSVGGVQVQKHPNSFDLFENLVKHQEIRAPHLPDQAERDAERRLPVRGEVGRDGEAGGCVLGRLYLPHHYPGCWRLPHGKRPEAPTEAQGRHLPWSLGRVGSSFRAALAPKGSGPPPGQIRLRRCPLHPEHGTMKVWIGRALLGPGFLALLWPAPLPSPTARTCAPNPPPHPRCRAVKGGIQAHWPRSRGSSLELQVLR